MNWFYQKGCLKNLLKIKIKKYITLNHQKQIARETIEVDDKHLNEEIAKKMVNLYYFTDRAL